MTNEAFMASYREMRAWAATPEGKVCEAAIVLVSNEAIAGESDSCSMKRYADASAKARAACERLRALIKALVAARDAAKAVVEACGGHPPDGLLREYDALVVALAACEVPP